VHIHLSVYFATFQSMLEAYFSSYINMTHLNEVSTPRTGYIITCLPMIVTNNKVKVKYKIKDFKADNSASYHNTCGSSDFLIIAYIF